MTVPVDEAYLIGGWMASAIWGAYTVIFSLTMFFIITKRKEELKKPTTWIICLMYCLATAHVFMALRRLILGLIILRDVEDPELYFFTISATLNRAKDLIYITNLILGDSIIIWRCYVVWERSKVLIAFPILMWIGTAIAGYGAIGQYFLTNPSFETSIQWGTAMFSISMATNIIVTSLTAGRIWWLVRPTQYVSKGFDRRYLRIILLVIESGAVITAGKLSEFILFKLDPPTPTGNHPMYIVFDMMPQITGIMPTLLIAVVNAGVTSTTTYLSNDASGGTSTRGSRPPPAKIMFRPREDITTGFGGTTGGSSTDVEAMEFALNETKSKPERLGMLGSNQTTQASKHTSYSSDASKAELGLPIDPDEDLHRRHV